MAYVEDIAIPLIRVLESATLHKGVRLAGFVANIDFWDNEVRHCLDCLAGYQSRFARLKNARIAYAQGHLEVQAEWVTPSLTADELSLIEKRVRAAATAFFRSCERYLERSQIIELEALLGIRIQNRRID